MKILRNRGWGDIFIRNLEGGVRFRVQGLGKFRDKGSPKTRLITGPSPLLP